MWVAVGVGKKLENFMTLNQYLTELLEKNRKFLEI